MFLTNELWNLNDTQSNVLVEDLHSKKINFYIRFIIAYDIIIKEKTCVGLSLGRFIRIRTFQIKRLTNNSLREKIKYTER